MQGKILIVDGISTNRIVLKVKLATAFYHVIQAGSIAQALAAIDAQKPDLVVTAVTLPDGTAADLCRKLRDMPKTASLPVLAIGCDRDKDARLDTLRAGAFDVMQRPLNEILLLGRVRSMIRAHHKLAEWQIREDTSCALGLGEAPAEFLRPGKICLIGPDAISLQGWVHQMMPELPSRYAVANSRDAMVGLHVGAPPDAVVLALPDTPDATDEYLRLIPALRASAQTRNVALLVVQQQADPEGATSALDMGADDVMIDGFDAAELAVRLKVLLKFKRAEAQVRQSIRNGLREVVNDPLTGLYNRRYAMPYMSRLIEQSTATKLPFAVILADMDHFKQVNDMYGHASGDAVLVETARRLRSVVREGDIIARMGGEEFMIAMPATDVATARKIANHLCETIGGTPFAIPGADESVPITISIGMTLSMLPMQLESSAAETVDSLLDRADKALYCAKMQGRNRVTLSQPQTRPAA